MLTQFIVLGIVHHFARSVIVLRVKLFYMQGMFIRNNKTAIRITSGYIISNKVNPLINHEILEALS